MCTGLGLNQRITITFFRTCQLNVCVTYNGSLLSVQNILNARFQSKNAKIKNGQNDTIFYVFHNSVLGGNLEDSGDNIWIDYMMRGMS